MTNRRLKQVLATTFNLPLENVPDDAEMGSIEAWTSLGHLELMMALEMEFRVQIPSDAMLDLTSVRLLENFIRTQGIVDT